MIKKIYVIVFTSRMLKKKNNNNFPPGHVTPMK